MAKNKKRNKAAGAAGNRLDAEMAAELGEAGVQGQQEAGQAANRSANRKNQ